ncbi:MAG: cyclic nucleotide-binding domain-containing protein [Bacteroidetes bacterium]|nr:cyclic nucleotide-binding domain-containing protein [Bacteroidota bacterium]
MNNKDNQTIKSSFWSNIFNSPGEKSDFIESLRSIPIFKEFSKRDVSQLLNLFHNRNYLAGEYIFYQDDPGIGLYIIREGEVVIQRNVDSNILISLATFGKGDFFGELALVDGEKRSASAVAKKDSKVAVIFKPDLDDFIERFPRKGIKILQGIAEIVTVRLRKLNEDHISLQSKLNVK